MFSPVVLATVVPDEDSQRSADDKGQVPVPSRSQTPPTPPVQAASPPACSRPLRLDLVMIRPPGINNGAFVVSPDSVWYARVLLLFSASALTDTGSKSFECALVSTLETYNDPENGNYDCYIHYINYVY